MRKTITMAVAGMICASFPALSTAQGAVWMTGHDPDWHASTGGNPLGAQHQNQAAMSFVWDGGSNSLYNAGVHKFLYVGDDGYQGSDSHTGDAGIAASGFTSSEYDIATSANLSSLLGGLGTTYSAIWVASGSCEFSQAELDILNANKTSIDNFVNAGGGLYAGAEGGSYGVTHDAYGFIPGAVSTAPLNEGEVADKLTSYGLSLGLVDTDINGNYSHNIFTATDNLNIVDVDANGNIVTLAGRTLLTPEPGPLLGFSLLTLPILWKRRRTTKR